MDLDKTLIADLKGAAEATNINVLRAKAHGFDRILDLLYQHGLHTAAQQRGIPPVIQRAEPPTEPPPVTEPQAETIAAKPPAEPAAKPPAEPAAKPPAEPAAEPTIDPPAVPVPAEDPGIAPRRRGRPRKQVAEDAAPSLLPAPQPSPEPAEATEPAAASEPEPATASDYDIPW